LAIRALSQWGDIDLEAATLKVEHSVEETKAGLRLKSPKTKSGRRIIETLKALRASQREERLALRLGGKPRPLPYLELQMGAYIPPITSVGIGVDWSNRLHCLRSCSTRLGTPMRQP
jgi:hypothetical protein